MQTNEPVDNALAFMFLQTQKQFGKAIKSYWFHEDTNCPCCGRIIDSWQHKGKESLSLNAYIYRKRGVLIGYFLCGRCAQQIHQDAKRNPGIQTAKHTAIEMNLDKAYEKHMNSMDA